MRLRFGTCVDSREFVRGKLRDDGIGGAAAKSFGRYYRTRNREQDSMVHASAGGARKTRTAGGMKMGEMAGRRRGPWSKTGSSERVEVDVGSSRSVSPGPQMKRSCQIAELLELVEIALEEVSGTVVRGRLLFRSQSRLVARVWPPCRQPGVSFLVYCRNRSTRQRASINRCASVLSKKSRLARVESDGQRWGKGKASRRSERVKCRENRTRGVGGKWVHARWKGGASTASQPASQPTGACGAGRTGGPEWTPGTHQAAGEGGYDGTPGLQNRGGGVDRALAHAVPLGQGFNLAGPQRLGGFAPGGR